MRAFVVEDIDIARKSLIKQLRKLFPEIEIVGEADSVLSALKQVHKLQPEVLFLDIDLPDGTAFDILESIYSDEFRIIFTTASDQYAIRAFQVSAVDYLLKPIDSELLKKAVEKVFEKLPTTGDQLDLVKNNLTRKEFPSQIALSTTDKVKLVQISDIIRCEASNNYTIFYFSDGTKEMVAKTLKSFDQILDPSLFLRTHQSHLVNFQYVKEFMKRDGGYLILKNEEMVPVSVRKRNAVVDFLRRI